MYRLGIDLGGTKIEGVVLDPGGGERFRERRPTRAERGYEQILQAIGALYERLVEAAGGDRHTLGLGIPGSLSPRTGLVRNANTRALNGRPLATDLAAVLGRTPRIENDANCFVRAEATLGAGRGYELVFGVIMGTGCGGGIAHSGEVRPGPTGIAGEWGHSTIDPAGARCWCGKRGCVETLISGGGAEARFAERYGRASSFESIVAGAAGGQEPEREFLAAFLEDFGRALSNVVNTLDPDAIVLGGGLSNVAALYAEGRDAVARHVFSDHFATPILRNELGDSAGVIGAALIGM